MQTKDVFREIFKWVEVAASIGVPIAAAIMLAFSDFSEGITQDRMLKIILVMVILLATLVVLHRFVTLREIESATKSIAEDVAQISKSPDLLRSIQESGIMNLFPKADERRMTDIVTEIRRSKGKLLLAGVAMPSMIENVAFRSAVLDKSTVSDVRILILNPDSKEAERRADIEKSLGRTTIAHIKGAVEWLQEKMIGNHRLRVHLYDLPPMLSLVINDQFVYVEPYHFGKIQDMEGCIGGKVPMMKIMNRPDRGADNSYAYFAAHFDYLWEMTRGRRVNLPLKMLEAEPSSYIVLQNESKWEIDLEDWTLTAQDSVQPYKFDAGNKWKSGDLITITQEKEGEYSGQVFYAEESFMGNNSILRLTNANGVMVMEWSIQQAYGD